MSLSKRLMDEMKDAMKNQDQDKRTLIRYLRSEIKNKEIEKHRDLVDDEIIEIIAREIKQRKDSLQQFEQAHRSDLVEQTAKQIELLSAYMPEQLSSAELQQIVEQTIQEVGATSKAEMGKVMGALMPKLKGRADGKTVQQLVQSLLQ